MLRGLEQAHRAALDDHVHRPTRLGQWVLISGSWYQPVGALALALCLGLQLRESRLQRSDVISENREGHPFLGGEGHGSRYWFLWGEGNRSGHPDQTAEVAVGPRVEGPALDPVADRRRGHAEAWSGLIH